MSHILVIANETAASVDAARRRARRGGGSDDLRHRDRAGERAEPGLRRLRGHAPRLRRPPPRQDAEGAPRGRRADAGLRRRDRPGAGGRRTRWPSSSRRSTRSSSRPTAPSARAGCAATSSRRSSARRRGIPVKHVTVERDPDERHERPRGREPDRRLRRAARPHPQAGREGAGRVPDRRAAERRRRARGRRPAPAPRAQPSCAAKGSTRTARSSIPTRYTAALTRRPRRARRRDHRLDVPGRASGWLRRDLVERLRKDTGLPVEHVISPVPHGR